MVKVLGGCDVDLDVGDINLDVHDVDVDGLSDNGSIELTQVVQAGSIEATKDLELVDLTGDGKYLASYDQNHTSAS